MYSINVGSKDNPFRVANYTFGMVVIVTPGFTSNGFQEFNLAKRFFLREILLLCIGIQGYPNTTIDSPFNGVQELGESIQGFEMSCDDIYELLGTIYYPNDVIIDAMNVAITKICSLGTISVGITTLSYS